MDEKPTGAPPPAVAPADGNGKQRRGFAAMSADKRREIARKGGRTAHELGMAHQWSSDEARAAGKKGGHISRGGRGRTDDPQPGA